MTLSDLDKGAMQRAIAILRLDSTTAEQIEHKLKREGFEKAGHFASYAVQCDLLNLRPWQAPPAHTRATIPDPNVYGERPGEIELRDRLLVAGLSVFEPNPTKALVEAERSSRIA
jgi:hypothetical protein